MTEQEYQESMRLLELRNAGGDEKCVTHSMVEALRREFKRDKLKKLLIKHRLRLCTLTKQEYVSFTHSFDE